jgi:hypothetical protein
VNVEILAIKKTWAFLEISQISPQSQKLKIPKLVQIIAQGFRNCRNTQNDFSENLHYRKTYKKEI